MKTILYVDDQAREAKLYCEALEDSGYKLRYFSTLKEARDVILNCAVGIDCAIVDIMMPCGDVKPS